MHSAKYYLINFLLIVSYVAVPTLLVFYWISKTEIKLLEVDPKADPGDVQMTLIYASLMYLVIAVILSIYVFFIRSQSSEEPNISKESKSRKTMIRLNIRQSLQDSPTRDRFIPVNKNDEFGQIEIVVESDGGLFRTENSDEEWIKKSK